MSKSRDYRLEIFREEKELKRTLRRIEQLMQKADEQKRNIITMKDRYMNEIHPA